MAIKSGGKRGRGYKGPPATSNAAAVALPPASQLGRIPVVTHRPARAAPAALKRYVIVRDIPDIAEKSKQELGAISGASCSALSKTGLGRVQWQHSYVAAGERVARVGRSTYREGSPGGGAIHCQRGVAHAASRTRRAPPPFYPRLPPAGKTFCIYLATDEEAIREHASIGGCAAQRGAVLLAACTAEQAGAACSHRRQPLPLLPLPCSFPIASIHEVTTIIDPTTAGDA